MIDIVRAIEQLSIPYDQIENDPSSKKAFWDAADLIEKSVTYRHLTAEEGHTIALAALKLYDTGNNADRYYPQMVLTHLANGVPGSPKGLYSQLLARDLYWREGQIFREADLTIRDHLIDLLASGIPDLTVHSSYTPDRLLCMLARIGDEAVQQTFQHWNQVPPPAFAHPEYFLHEAGWELTPEGKRRDLYFQLCYDLAPEENGPAQPVPEPVLVGGMCEEHCGWCGRRLALLFDFDLQASQVAAIWPQGESLRIPLCLNCSFQWSSRNDRLFMDVDGYGLARWSDINGTPPKYLRIYKEHENGYIRSFPEQPYRLGEARRTPYESDGSHIGGCPGWPQGSDFPQCPVCQQTMLFVGQCHLRTLKLAYLDGYLFAFICPLCGKATIGHHL